MSNDRKFPSVSATRSAVFVGVPLAMLLGASAVSGAVELKQWSAGETLTANDLNVNFATLAAAVEPRGWVECGVAWDMNGVKKCEIPNYSPLQYEYGMPYNGEEPNVVDCTLWNVGVRITNRWPYFVQADNPTDGNMRRGGFVLYTGTNATDDDIPDSCAADQYRHRYWQDSAGAISLLTGNGCMNPKIYCRAR